MGVHLKMHGDLAVMTLDRQEAMNALNAEMIGRIAAAIDAAAAASPRALLVTGAGGKAFCAGADVKELLGQDGDQQGENARRGQAAFTKLDRLAFPSLAVIRGVALGGGLELAMACSFRIAAPGTKLGLPELRLGLLPGYGGTQRLPRIVGAARALELIASGRLVEAEEALAIGLVHQVRAITDPVQAGEEFLARFGERQPAAFRFARDAVAQAQVLPLAEGLELEARLFSQVSQTEDAAEGMRAFIEKRKPRFVGR